MTLSGSCRSFLLRLTCTTSGQSSTTVTFRSESFVPVPVIICTADRNLLILFFRTLYLLHEIVVLRNIFFSILVSRNLYLDPFHLNFDTLLYASRLTLRYFLSLHRFLHPLIPFPDQVTPHTVASCQPSESSVSVPPYNCHPNSRAHT